MTLRRSRHRRAATGIPVSEFDASGRTQKEIIWKSGGRPEDTKRDQNRNGVYIELRRTVVVRARTYDVRDKHYLRRTVVVRAR